MLIRMNTVLEIIVMTSGMREHVSILVERWTRN